MTKNKLNIIFCGTRGIPANYGGFETAVEKITDILANKNVHCYVVCRQSSYNIEEIKLSNISNENISLVWVKGSKVNVLDTIISSIETSLYLLRNKEKFDTIFWFNNANFPGILLSKFTNKQVIINTDGLEWKRAKWSLPFKMYYFFTTFLITRLFSKLISDSKSIKDYYKKVFMKNTEFIPYGVPNEISPENIKEDILDKYGLEKDRYFLQITRFEPDNLPLKIIKGFSSSDIKDKYKFVLVGYKNSNKYTEEIKKIENQNENILVLDAIYDKEIIAALRVNAFSYVHGNSVGGTNPALLEAMSQCKRVMAIDNGFSREVLGKEGIFFNDVNISEVFNEIIYTNDNKTNLSKRTKLYDWTLVANAYLNMARGEKADYNPGEGKLK
jgi:Domain of unknown function (DUF1972)/Glycosyl transferases group 1